MGEPVARKIMAELQNSIAAEFGIEKVHIQPWTKLESLGADSLDMIDLILKLEEMFHVKLDRIRIPEVTTIGDLAECIQQRQLN